MVLCCNKIDLESDRAVSYEEGLGLAEEFGIGFYEVSAKTGENVNEMFMSLAESIKNNRIPAPAEEGMGISNLVGEGSGGSGSGGTDMKQQEETFGFKILSSGSVRGGGGEGGRAQATTLDKCCG